MYISNALITLYRQPQVRLRLAVAAMIVQVHPKTAAHQALPCIHFHLLHFQQLGVPSHNGEIIGGSGNQHNVYSWRFRLKLYRSNFQLRYFIQNLIFPIFIIYRKHYIVYEMTVKYMFCFDLNVSLYRTSVDILKISIIFGSGV